MAHTASSHPMIARAAGPLSGTARVPGDKSISHRALILSTLAVGETRISGLLEAEDVLNTAEAMRAFGASVVRVGPGGWHIHGVGVGGLAEPESVLDFGNSGTGSRLVMGLMATSPISAVFTGDASLRRRPMGRVLEPLRLFGAEAVAREGGLMPLTLKGARDAMPVRHHVKVASAQVKSALLLAALNAPGKSTISQSALTRDHTEKMLAAFGAEISVEPLEGGGEAVTVTGEAELKPAQVDVPRDPSSAAFPLVAALLVPGSEVLIPAVLLNPRRIGLLYALREMGANVEVTNRRLSGGEEVGDLTVRASALKGFEVPAEWAPSMIDEYPILSVAAAFASGRTVMRGLEELRVKESDRLAAMAAGLKAIGVRVEELPDGLIIEGTGGEVRGCATVETHMDHRIAMSFLVAGLATREPVTVDDTAMIATSFPEFVHLMQNLGAELVEG
ncbi:MAG: 3-phosphoshikimate 1-carboxyvinyltransferase [Alphaproteobacteria bacterium]|nr:3-phosphoshikimate 1-carboxyvinyltransferase [Alphaproteobacteria bacterium]